MPHIYAVMLSTGTAFETVMDIPLDEYTAGQNTEGKKNDCLLANILLRVCCLFDMKK